jgi:hypothetical protein
MSIRTHSKEIAAKRVLPILFDAAARGVAARTPPISIRALSPSMDALRYGRDVAAARRRCDGRA